MSSSPDVREDSDVSNDADADMDPPEKARPTTHITVTQKIGKVIGGEVTGINIGQILGDVFIGSGEKEASDRANKLLLLQKVKDFWIEGVLNRSIYGASLIDIEKTEQPDAVDRPWGMVVQAPDQSALALPTGKKILEIFDGLGRTMLILGEPGSGKTTEMLELAQEATIRAEKDPTLPILVVFNLSSWTKTKETAGFWAKIKKTPNSQTRAKLTIAEWLVIELSEKYQIPSRIGRHWVGNGEIFPLLDGLDEVSAENREACVEAINQFIQEFGCPLVVCCRTQEYQSLKSRLKLHGAIALQPLTSEQIDSFVAAGGQKLSGLASALKSDAALQELAKTPLMLSIMSLAYQNMPAGDIAYGEANRDDQQKWLFDAYVNSMFVRVARTKSERYTKEQTVSWLSWLAGRMKESNQTVFLVEKMQPTWLKTYGQRGEFVILSAIFCGMYFGFISLFVLLELGPDPKNFVANYTQLLSLIFYYGPPRFLLGLIFGMLIGIGGGAQNLETEIKVIKWSWKGYYGGRRIRKTLPTLLIWPVSLYIILKGLSYPSIGVTIFGFGILFLLGIMVSDIEKVAYPAHGIKHNDKIYFIFLSLCCLIGIGLAYLWKAAISYGLACGLSYGLLFIFFGGFINIINHKLLCLVFYRSDKIPWNYVKFLDQAAERIFLRKVGGGYIFVHGLLMEYFAAIEPVVVKSRAAIIIENLIIVLKILAILIIVYFYISFALIGILGILYSFGFLKVPQDIMHPLYPFPILNSPYAFRTENFGKIISIITTIFVFLPILLMFFRALYDAVRQQNFPK